MYIQYVLTRSLPFFVVTYPIVLPIEYRFSQMLYVLFVRIFIHYIIYGALQPPFVYTVLSADVIHIM